MIQLSSYDDARLLEMMSGSKEEADLAFQEIYRRFSPRVHAYILRILEDRDQAEDLFQETFVKFYQKASSSSGKSNIVGFLITIARNLCLNYKRDKKSSVPVEDYHLVIDDNITHNKAESAKLVKMAFDLLEFEYREPLILRLYNGLNYNDISEICNISPANARKRVFRAKQKIKEILEPYFKDYYN